jgi:hypothetical protein
MAVAPTSRALVCTDHPDRPAHARCMSCRKVLCDECATQWDGINYCSRCLQARGTAARTRTAWLPGLLMVVVIGTLLFFHARLMVWMGVLVAPLL